MVFEEIKAFISRYDHFLVAGHVEPDGDCVASQIACCELLLILGKKASLYSSGPFRRPETAVFSERFSKIVPPELLASPATALIVLDCSGFERLGGLGQQIEGLPCMVVDHHATGMSFGDVRYVEPTSPSTTLLVLSLFEAFGILPSPELARLLLFGLATDTGFFRHLRSDSAAALRAAAHLVELGASPADAFSMIYGGQALETRKLLGRTIDRAESHMNDRVLFTWLTLEDKQAVSHYQDSDDDLYRLLQTVRGNEIVVLVKEEGPNAYSVGLRSSGFDVGAVARSMGGGGHRCAAGFDTSGPLDKIRQAVLGALSSLGG
jgi:phosphoesterase RecJ-like protein